MDTKTPTVAAAAPLPPSAGGTPGEPSSSARRSAGVTWGLAAFVISRWVLVLLLIPPLSDVQLYFHYAKQGVDLGQVPYRDFSIEYPPVAYWLMAAPRWVARDTITPAIAASDDLLAQFYGPYVLTYKLLMVFIDVAVLMMLLGIVRRRRPDRAATAVFAYVVTTTILGCVVYDRLDLGLALLLTGWAYASVRSAVGRASPAWRCLAYAMLGLSVSFKLVGVVLIPFQLLADWRGTGGLRAALRRTVPLATVCGLAIALPFAVHYPSSGFGSLEFLRFHGERGIQLESLYSSALLALRPFGLDAHIEITHGAGHLVGTGSAFLARFSLLLVLTSWGACAWWAWRQGPRFDRPAAYRLGCFLLLPTLLFSKVLSPQFFVFAIPVMLLLAVETMTRRENRLLVAALVVLTLLTTAIFPVLYSRGALHPWLAARGWSEWTLSPDLHVFPCTLLLMRNLTFAGVVGWFGWRLFRSADAGPVPALEPTDVAPDAAPAA